MTIRDDDGRKSLEIPMRLMEVCGGLPIDDRLAMLELAWIVVAQQARAEAPAFPGGFPAARARQLDRLTRMIMLVRLGIPDLEAERCIQKGDAEGLLNHCRWLRKIAEADDDFMTST